VDSITWTGRLRSLIDWAAGRSHVRELTTLAERNVLYEFTRQPKAAPSRGGKEIAMNLWVRSWSAAGIALLALTSIPEIYAVVQPSGVANADVCASVGRRVSVSGCTNVADTVNTYVPPPADYAPLPQDFPPPPPPPVNVCVGVGRRIHVSGCT
jgi:hypothetical protein